MTSCYNASTILLAKGGGVPCILLARLRIPSHVITLMGNIKTGATYGTVVTYRIEESIMIDEAREQVAAAPKVTRLHARTWTIIAVLWMIQFLLMIMLMNWW